MEKIQNALAKARAERKALLARENATPPASTEVPSEPALKAVSDQDAPAPVVLPDAVSETPVDAVTDVRTDASTEPNDLSEPTETLHSPHVVADAWAAISPFEISPNKMERNRIVALQEGRAGSEFDMMRTRVLQQMRANNWRRIAITSPTAACGKSTVALNLAFSLSRQPDLRTILMELDLRRPSLAHALGLTTGHKFAHVLAGEAALADHAVRYGENLIIATNRSSSQRSSELLQGTKAVDALADIETMYEPDIVIMDMPPMLVSDDTIAFMDRVDCVLLIAAAEATKVKEVDMCERELAQHTNVMGVILNKCRYTGPDYGYGYYS